MTILLLITLYLLLFTLLSYKNTKWGIYLVVTLLPTYLIRFTVFSVPMTLLEGMIWLLFIVWFIKLKKERGLSLNPLIWIKNMIDHKSSIIDSNNPIPKPYRLPIVLFLIASTFSVFISPNFDAASGIWKAYFVEALMFFIIFVYTIKSTDDLRKVIRFLGPTVIIIGIFAVIQKLTGALIPNPFWADEATRRVTTFFGYPNANALLIAPIILLTIGNFLSDKKSLVFQSFNLLVLVLGILTIIWTKSAGAVIGLAVGLIFLLIFYKKTRLAILMIILAASLFFWFSPKTQNYFQNQYISASEIHLPAQASDLQIRAQQWRETITMLADKPFLGAGMAGYQMTIKPYHVNQHLEIFLYPHNFFLNFWTEMGLLGLVSMIWIIIIFFIINFKFSVLNFQRQALTLTTSCAMITLLVHGLVDVPYFKNDLSVLFWIIIGLMIVLYNLHKQPIKND